MVFLGVKPDNLTLAAPCHSNRMILNEDTMRMELRYIQVLQRIGCHHSFQVTTRG
ncbi:MAG: hypothetical protein ACI9FB_001246 [Candidatus Azotimanducaceae bacterium]|jgi:hypothetical protein